MVSDNKNNFIVPEALIIVKNQCFVIRVGAIINRAQSWGDKNKLMIAISGALNQRMMASIGNNK